MKIRRFGVNGKYREAVRYSSRDPNAMVYHLNHPDSIMRYARLKFRRGYWRMAVYKRYPNKMLKDSYTPQTLKIQILFSPILKSQSSKTKQETKVIAACGIYFVLWFSCDPFAKSCLFG
jgi:hypothetical protein